MNDTATPGRPRRAGVEDQVLEATVALVAEQGYAGTSLDAIARRAGVAKTTVYRRWDSKRDLVVDALDSALGAPPVTDTSSSAGRDGRAGEGLAVAIEWLATRVGTPDVRLLLIGLAGEAARDPDLRTRLQTRLRRPFTAQVAEQWSLPPARVELAFDVVVGTLLHRVAMAGDLAPGDVGAVTDLARELLFG